MTVKAVPADEFDEYLTEALQNPSFRAAYEAAQQCFHHWDTHHPRPLAINGYAYHRRQKARRRRRR